MWRGVDKAVEVLDVARTAFHPADVARLERAPSEEARRVQFFRHWTLKEALGKADGRGLGPSGDGSGRVRRRRAPRAGGCDAVLCARAGGWVGSYRGSGDGSLRNAVEMLRSQARNGKGDWALKICVCRV